jgi:uncharacterized surface protein with fasciclin (FAS1) repeats
MKTFKIGTIFLVLLFVSYNSLAQTGKDIVEVAVNSKDHTTLVKALAAADLVNTLKGKGSFTVFAPTNEAFVKLPGGTLDTLLLSENKSKLAVILTYHVVALNLDAKAIIEAIRKGDGKVVLTTVEGGTLTATVVKGKVILMDENGGKATVTATDLEASNGVIHVIDKVLMPR